MLFVLRPPTCKIIEIPAQKENIQSIFIQAVASDFIAHQQIRTETQMWVKLTKESEMEEINVALIIHKWNNVEVELNAKLIQRCINISKQCDEKKSCVT
ncbi:CLUMA_CG010105, isoform A [Clunio marinus]|uniref:CLUMA_CG010105, isoform A n=1 Tax=Clunio marinus TaxID=568069 RepID=A0A1J1I805_9DIPT|nr:CLUMA_CG010105, isoform A [Clunio marinus]